MTFKTNFITISLLTTNLMLAQIPHDINVNSNGSAERVARFKVQDEPRDFLEITNSTQYANSFIPSIWAHQESDNRYVLRHFATTKSSLDYGNIPLMVFTTQLRDKINLSAPNETSKFPWGASGNNVKNRPAFGWENGASRLMTLNANGNLGLGANSPTAKLHTNGTVRFQNLPNSYRPTYILVTDSNGNVHQYPTNLYKQAINFPVSDKNLVKNITEIDNPLETILKLNGKKFESQNVKQIGLIAQDVKNILPESVSVNNKGEYGINYTSLIPVLIEALKEQQNQISLLQNHISEKKSLKLAHKLINGKTYFSTNFPNPFSTTTTINYFVEENIKNARIIIYNSNGKTISNYPLQTKGKKSQFILNKDKLESGIYFYTMIADDIVIGTKKMIVK